MFSNVGGTKVSFRCRIDRSSSFFNVRKILITSVSCRDHVPWLVRTKVGIDTSRLSFFSMTLLTLCSRRLFSLAAGSVLKSLRPRPSMFSECSLVGVDRSLMFDRIAALGK